VGKGVRGQNLDNKGLAGWFLSESALLDIAEFTSFAWAIIGGVVGAAQGQMSQGWAVEN
jgi:hypothetical protein